MNKYKKKGSCHLFSGKNVTPSLMKPLWISSAFAATQLRHIDDKRENGFLKVAKDENVLQKRFF